MENDVTTYRKALDDFRHARSKAAMQRFWAGMQGKSLDLLPYDEISTKLHAISQSNRGLQNVKLKDIVGSVGRNEDFDRNFLPLRDSDINRWAQVKTAMVSPNASGVPPITLYKIGEAYFVMDGNHRVSIAKEMGMEEIEAYVTEIKTKVPISSSITAEELVIKSAYVDFLDETRLDQILPGVDFSLNLVENYSLLKEHIAVHRYYMGIEQDRDVGYEDAVIDWYDRVYSPVVEIIESSGLKQEFKQMSITDLYLWVLDQQSLLQNSLGMPIRTENAADYMAHQEGKTLKPSSNRGEQHFIETVFSSGTSDLAENELHGASQADCLFRDILVAIGDDDTGWEALEQAILINRCPEGNIRGLHVINSSDSLDESMHRRSEDRFEKRLQEVGMQGRLLLVEGEITTMVTEHSLLNDLLVLKLTYPPTGGIFDRLSSGIVTILHRSRRPILIVKEKPMPFDSALIVYDGSPKSKEALFMGAYFAARFGTQLDLFTLDNGQADIESEVSYAKTYLRKLNLDFSYHLRKGENLTKEILSAVEEVGASVLILGGYSGSSFFDRVFGTAVDSLLEQISIPTLISQ
ncbi:MAG: hypothetical protein WA110_10520 [Anaerolineaceae bacterium]